MTPEHVKALLPILTAYANGETIQIGDPYSAEWSDADKELHFKGSPENYRVKPKPHEFYELVWIVKGTHSTDTHSERFSTRRYAESFIQFQKYSTYKITHYVEVLEDTATGQN